MVSHGAGIQSWVCLTPGVCDLYNLVFWEKLGWKAADSEVISCWVRSHRAVTHISVSRGLVMWIAPLWKSTRRKSIHEGQPPGSLISQGSRVHRISHVAGLFSSSLVLGKALFFLAWFLGKPVICSSHLPDLYCWVHR